VGRVGQKAWCFLLTKVTLGETALNRLNILKSESDGFKLAEYDYEQRGAGEFLGFRQHGRGTTLISADMVRTAREISELLLSDPARRIKIEAAATAEGGLGDVIFN